MKFMPITLLLLCVAAPCRTFGEDSLAREFRTLREMMGRREFGEAISRCEELIGRYPYHMPLYETLGEVHQYAGRLPEGISFLEGRIVEGTGIRLAYYGLGNIYFLMQEDRSAIRYLNRAIELGLDHPDCYKLLEYAYERLEGVDNTIKAFTVLSHRYPENANYWYALGLAHWGKGDFATSRVHLAQALSRCSQEPRFRQALAALNLSTRGLPSDRIALKDEMDRASSRGDMAAVAYLSATLVQYLVSEGANDIAEVESGRTLVETERFGYLKWNSWANLKLADLSYFKGAVSTAILHLRKSIVAGLLSASPTVTRDAWERDCESHVELGDLMEAIRSLELRIRYLEWPLSERDRAKALLDLCRITNERGDYVSALDYGTQALSQAVGTVRDSVFICQIHTGLGLAFLGLKNVADAKRHLDISVACNPSDAFHAKVASVTIGNLGDLSLEEGRLSVALRQFGRQRILAITSGFRREEGLAEANLAMTLELKGQIDRAKAHYRNGHEIGVEIRNAALVAQCAKGLARIHQRTGDDDLAIRWHLEAVRVADSMVILSETARAYPDYSAFIGLLARSKRYAEAFLVADRSKAYAHRGSLLAALEQHRVASTAGELLTAESRSRTRLLDGRGLGRGIADLWAQGDATGERGEEPSDLRGELIAANGPTSAALKYPISPEGSERFLKDVQTLLPDSSILVEFSRADDRWVIFVVSRDSLEFIETQLTTSQMEGLIERSSRIFVSDLADQKLWNAALAQFEPRALSELYQATMSLVRAKRPEARQFIIIPDGPFRKIPFECLICADESEVGDEGLSRRRFLIEDCSMTYLPTATSLALRKERRSSEPESCLLAVGGITAPAHRSELDPLIDGALSRIEREHVDLLPGTLAEISALRDIVQMRTTILSRKEATRERLLDEGPRHRFIHIAAHVRRDVRYPWMSGFAVSSIRDSDEEEISLFDLIQMSRSSELVVLNGCSSNSPAKDSAPGGFGPALLTSGVPSVVSTLWDIDDTRAVKVMVGFYGYLHNGMTTDQALRQAKLDFIRSESSDPYYWAGFILNGVPLNLMLGQAGEEKQASAGFLAVSAGAGVFLVLIILARNTSGSSLLRLGCPG